MDQIVKLVNISLDCEICGSRYGRTLILTVYMPHLLYIVSATSPSILGEGGVLTFVSKYRINPISRCVYYLNFFSFGWGYYLSCYPSNTPDQKNTNILFLRFDIINKLPLEHNYSLWLRFMFEKLKSFAESTIQLRLLFGSVR